MKNEKVNGNINDNNNCYNTEIKFRQVGMEKGIKFVYNVYRFS